MDYRQEIVQPAIADIRISMHVFEDVIKVLHIVLAVAKVHRNAHHEWPCAINLSISSTLMRPLQFRVFKDEDALVVFEGSCRVSTQYDNFRWRFEEAFKADAQEVLINSMAPSKDKVLFKELINSTRHSLF